MLTVVRTNVVSVEEIVQSARENILMRPFLFVQERLQEYYEYFVIGPRPIVDADKYRGKLGWQQPDSVSWRLFSDPSSIIAVFAAMIMQSAHPVIADAFQRFGSYEEHPERRFWLTGGFYFATTFGSEEEAEAWISKARAGHRGIRGKNRAGDDVLVAHPDVLLFSHLCVVYSTIAAWEKYGPSPRALSAADKDRFCEEQSWAAIAIGARNVPMDYQSVLDGLNDYLGVIEKGLTERAALESVLSGRGLPFHARAIYKMIVDAAIAILPQSHCAHWPLRSSLAHVAAGTAFVETARNALPELSCVASAKARVEGIGERGDFEEPLQWPFYLQPSGLEAGKKALEALGQDEVGISCRQMLELWWIESPNLSQTLFSDGISQRLVSSGFTLRDGTVTRLASYAAAYLAIERNGAEAVARRASSTKGAERLIAPLA